MTITAARPAAMPSGPATWRDPLELDADERKALELQVENGSASLRPHPDAHHGFTHRLEASDGWIYHVTLADAD